MKIKEENALSNEIYFWDLFDFRKNL